MPQNKSHSQSIFRRVPLALKLVLAHRLRSKWRGIQTSFIVSNGRTGTETLAKVLTSSFHHVRSVHEPVPDMFTLGVSVARSEKTQDSAGKEFLVAREGERLACTNSGSLYYVESNNNLSYLVPALRLCFPECRIVHIVRDGHDAVRSSYSRLTNNLDGTGETALFMSEGDARRRLQAADLPDDPYYARWQELSRFERLCWYWVKKNSIVDEAIKDDPLAMTCRFEDIFAKHDGFPGFWEIVNFLDLRGVQDLSDDQIRELLSLRRNRSGDYQLGIWPSWSQEQLRQFEHIAGEYQRRLGYPC